MFTNKFEASIEIKTLDGKSVFFKHDGTRFINSVTIKLWIGTLYNVNVYFRPAMKLNKWLIQGKPVEFTQSPPKRKGEDVSVFTTPWFSEGFHVTKDGVREEIYLDFEMEGELTMSAALQVKFYAPGDSSASKLGQPMHALDLSADSSSGQGSADVIVRRGSVL